LKKLLAQLMVPLLMFAFQLPLPAQEAAARTELALIDLRPQEEKDGNGLLPLNGKCNKEVFRIADVATDPLKVEVLKSELWERLSSDDAAKTFTVLNWSIYYNKQVQTKGGGVLQSVGVGGYNIPTAQKKERRAGSRCTQRDSAGGWYDGSEIHSVYYPLISEFAGTYGGKPFKARVVYSPSVKLTGKFAGAEDDTQALLELVHQTSEAVVGAIVQ
jgi:hypothetical protein